MSIRLGVNIDHVATLRQARRSLEPDLVEAARVSKSAGADFIVVHIRMDRRHIQDDDLISLKRHAKLPIHLEMSTSDEIVKIALKLRPDSVCIVPERPGEVTTEGGLDFKKYPPKPLEGTVKTLQQKGIEVSLFIDPDPESLRTAKKLGADTVEFCTAQYAKAWGKKSLQAEQLERLELAARLAHEMGLILHAGHDLDYRNVIPVAKIPYINALNIGFAIVSRAVFTGLRTAVSGMKQLVERAQV